MANKNFDYEIIPVSDSFAFFDYMREHMDLYLIRCIIHGYNEGFNSTDVQGLMRAFLEGTFKDPDKVRDAIIKACNTAIEAIES